MFGHLKLFWSATLLVFLINIPFGYWRARVRRFSLKWILAIHLPIPFVIACRLFLGWGWQLSTIPILMAAFFMGQFAGGKVQRLVGSSR